jgi:hypothetical protein
MKKIDNNPVVLSALLSMLFDHFDGNLMSNAPKNDIAKITNIAKNIKLKNALVAKSFNFPAPNIIVMANPNTTYITMMLIPYVNASAIDFDFAVPFFKKKLIVIGIIGHTHGVNSAAKPPKNPHNMIDHHVVVELFATTLSLAIRTSTGFHHFEPPSVSSLICSGFVGSATASLVVSEATGVPTVKSNGSFVGGMHAWSLQP